MAYLDFKDVREFVHNLSLKTEKEWKRYCKSGYKPRNIPTSPYSVYTAEWTNWFDWFSCKKEK